MFSKILTKLIDQAIVPAIVLLAIRVISVVLVSKYFLIDMTITQSGFTFSRSNDYILVNSYSTLFMVITLTVGLLYILLKSYIFHETHVSPQMTAKLFSLRISSLIQTSFDVYSQGVVWLSYLFLIMIVSGVSALFNLIFAWVFYTSAVLAIISTILLILDVENELVVSKDKLESDYLEGEKDE